MSRCMKCYSDKGKGTYCDDCRAVIANEKRLQALAELQEDGERMELKPCPFCGYWAIGFYDDNSDYESHHNYGVSCQAWLDKQSPKCGVSISGYKTKGEAYTAWNTRHSEQASFNKALDLMMEEFSKQLAELQEDGEMMEKFDLDEWMRDFYVEKYKSAIPAIARMTALEPLIADGKECFNKALDLVMEEIYSAAYNDRGIMTIEESELKAIISKLRGEKPKPDKFSPEYLAEFKQAQKDMPNIEKYFGDKDED